MTWHNFSTRHAHGVFLAVDGKWRCISRFVLWREVLSADGHMQSFSLLKAVSYFQLMITVFVFLSNL